MSWTSFLHSNKFHVVDSESGLQSSVEAATVVPNSILVTVSLCKALHYNLAAVLWLREAGATSSHILGGKSEALEPECLSLHNSVIVPFTEHTDSWNMTLSTSP